MGFLAGRLVRVALASAVICAAPAQSATPDYGKAYGFALRCFVAGGAAAPNSEDDPDGTTAKAVRDYAHKAYDTVYFMGGKLGYSKARISADLDRAQAVEMRRMVQSRNYFAQTKLDCIKLGLMQP